MQKAQRKNIVLVLLSIAACFMIGCSDAELLDETEQQYSASIEFLDGDTGEDVAPTLQIDVVQINCGTDPTTPDPEPYTETLAEISVTLAPNAPAITIRRYRIEYIPLLSTDVNGNLVLPIDLTEPEDGAKTLAIPSTTGGSTTTFTITWLTEDVKTQFRNWWSATPTLETGRYAMRVTLYYTFLDGEEGEVDADRTVTLSEYYRCD